MVADLDAGHGRPVLVDSSSAIILYKCGLINEVLDYYRIIMAGSVFFEITRENYAGSDDFSRFRNENKIHVIDGIHGGDYGLHVPPLNNLGSGEGDTILLYCNKIGEMIILDDRKGAAYCKKNDIQYINALLVPRILNLAGRVGIHEREDLMNKIVAYGRYTQKIIDYAYFCEDEKIVPFL